MSPEVLGIVLILTMLFAIFIGFPISFTLIFLGRIFWLSGFWRSCFLFNDLPVFWEYARANPCSDSSLYLYGNSHGEGKSHGAIIYLRSDGTCQN